MILEMFPSGKFVDLLNFTINDFDIRDVAHSLSNTCRFNGHCRRFYSVAEHCVRMVEFYRKHGAADHDTMYAMLMHDAAEAYIGDISRPVKNELPRLRQIENKILREIGIEYSVLVKSYDDLMLKIEARALTVSGGKNWPGFEGLLSYEEEIEKSKIMTIELLPSYWRDRFLDLYAEVHG